MWIDHGPSTAELTVKTENGWVDYCDYACDYVIDIIYWKLQIKNFEKYCIISEEYKLKLKFWNQLRKKSTLHQKLQRYIIAVYVFCNQCQTNSIQNTWRNGVAVQTQVLPQCYLLNIPRFIRIDLKYAE